MIVVIHFSVGVMAWVNHLRPLQQLRLRLIRVGTDLSIFHAASENVKCAQAPSSLERLLSRWILWQVCSVARQSAPSNGWAATANGICVASTAVPPAGVHPMVIHAMGNHHQSLFVLLPLAICLLARPHRSFVLPLQANHMCSLPLRARSLILPCPCHMDLTSTGRLISPIYTRPLPCPKLILFSVHL